jgi:hypothetical protein
MERAGRGVHEAGAQFVLAESVSLFHFRSFKRSNFSSKVLFQSLDGQASSILVLVLSLTRRTRRC